MEAMSHSKTTLDGACANVLPLPLLDGVVCLEPLGLGIMGGGKSFG